MGTPWYRWMIHWSRFKALLMRVMLHTISTHHNNCRCSWINLHSYIYSQKKFRGLSPPIHHINYLSLVIPKADCYLPLIWRWYTKRSKIDHHTPQMRHPHTKSHQDINQSYFPSAYIAISTNFKTSSSCTPPCTSSEGGIIHWISSEGGSTRTTTTYTISSQENII